MDGREKLLHIAAHHGGIAAGRDVNLHCDIAICPRCEVRLIRSTQTACRHCLRAELRHQRRHDRTHGSLQLELGLAGDVTTSRG